MYLALPSLLVVIIAATLTVVVPIVNANVDVYFGQSAALTGPSAAITARYNLGLLTALGYTNAQGGVYGRNLKLRVLDDGGDANRAADNTRRLLALGDTIALVAYLSTETVRAALPIARAAKVPIVAPMTGAMEFRLGSKPDDYHQYLIHMRVSHNDEAVGMMRVMFTQLQKKRWCVVYDPGTFDAPMNMIISEMTALGLTTSCLMNTTEYNAPAVVDRVVSVNAQGVVLLTAAEWSAAFLDVYYASSSANSASASSIRFVSGSWAAEPLRLHYHARGYPAVDLIVTQVTPLPNSAKSYVARLYRAVMTGVHGAGVKLDHLSFEGFLTGRFLFEVMKRMYMPNTSGFLSAIYGTALFQLLEVFVGPYARSYCPFVNNVASERGRPSTCNCSTGMRYVDFLGLDDNATAYTQVMTPMTFELLLCEALPTTQAPTPFTIGVPQTSMANTNNLFVGLSSKEALKQTSLWAEVPVKLFPIPVTDTTKSMSTNAIYNTGNDTFLTAAIGFTPTEHQSTIPIISGVTEHMLHKDQLGRNFAREKLFVFPTFPQEVHAAMTLVRDLALTRVTVAYRSTGLPVGQSELQYYVSASLRTVFPDSNGENIAVTLVPFGNTAELTASVTNDNFSLTLIVGLSGSDDLRAVADALVARPFATALVLFSEAAAAWEGLSGCTLATHGAALRRLRLTSNIPLWTTAGTSAFAARYQKEMSDSASPRHPMTVLGYVTARVLNSLLRRASSKDGAMLIDAAYQFSTFFIADLAVGPFDDDDRSKCNVGVRRMHHYHAAAVLFDDYDNSTGVSVVTFQACGVAYAPLSSSSSNDVMVTIIVCVVAIPAVLVAGLFWALSRKARHARNAHAPREPPMCLLSTDIQASTRLWELFPNEMPQAVDTHHTIIRRLVKEYDAYEVKTIGDAFAIAVKSTLDGALLAFDIQLELFGAEWPPGLDVNRIYTNCDTNPDVWHGLRVRIGIHHATDVTTTYDAMRGRYDYHGADVMVLKKVESSAD
eukprot:PhM_4_TR13282/c2_g4_i1/m.36317